MLEEEGIVVALQGALAEVEAQPKAGCGSCSARGGCGTALVARLFPQRGRRFLARNEAGAVPGDRVVIGLDEGAMQWASVLLYLLPLLGLIGGALLGDALARQWGGGSTELWSVLTGAAGMALVFGSIRARLGQKQDSRFQAVVLRILPGPVVGLGAVPRGPGSADSLNLQKK